MTLIHTPYPPVDLSFAKLRAAGWHLAEYVVGIRWMVEGANGENQIRAEGGTQAEAWHRAVEQALYCGMAGVLLTDCSSLLCRAKSRFGTVSVCLRANST